MIRVYDYEEDLFLETARNVLFRSVSEKEGLVIVSVAEGGTPLAYSLKKLAFNLDFLDVSICTVKCQRNTTRIKKSFVSKKILFTVVRLLPLRVRNFLRIIEHYILTTLSFRHYGRVVTCSLEEKEVLANAAFVIVVDDAIDSGATLGEVIKFVEAVAPVGCAVKSFVYVVTRSAPSVMPDFYCLENVLVRFPGALDA